MKPSRLKAWRCARSWTQAQAATKLACSISLVQAMEQGIRTIRPPYRRIMELMDELEPSNGAEKRLKRRGKSASNAKEKRPR